MAGMLNTDLSGESVDLSGKGLRQLGNVNGVHGKVLSLNLDNNYLHSLEGTNQFPNLMQLSARSNRVIDLSPLFGLTHLVIANLQNNAISTIQGMEPLKCLQWISLAGNAIKDPSGITKCASLTHLDLSDNFIKNLPDLSNLTSLKTLLLHGNGLKILHNSPPLPSSLHTLTLAENGIIDLNEFSCLHSLKSLRQLSLMGNPCSTNSTADGRLIEYRTFILYYCPSVSVLDGIATTDVERYQSRMVFFGFDQCPFTIGQHMDLIQYLSKKAVTTAPPYSMSPPPPTSSPASKLFVSPHLSNNENKSPNRTSSRGPRILGPPPDPEASTVPGLSNGSNQSSSLQRQYPLSPKRSLKKSPEASEGPEILETFQTLRYIQQMIKEQEQLILDQSMSTSKSTVLTTTNSEDNEVGVVFHQRKYGDVIVQELESSDNTLLTPPEHSQIPRTHKEFSITSPSDRGVVKLHVPPGSGCSPSTNGELLASSTEYLPLPSSCNKSYSDTQDVRSLASSISQAYGLPLSVSSPQSFVLSSDHGGGGLLSTLLNVSDTLELPRPPGEDRVRFSKDGDSKLEDKTRSSEDRDSNLEVLPKTPKDTAPFSGDSVQCSVASLSIATLPDTTSCSLMTASSQETVEYAQPHPQDGTKQELLVLSSGFGVDGIPDQRLARTHSDTITETGTVSPGKDGADNGINNDQVSEATFTDACEVTDKPDGTTGGVAYELRSNTFQGRDRAVIVIQSLWRGFLSRKSGKLRKHKAAVTIQSAWRGYYCRMYHPFVGYVYREMRRRKTEAYITLLYLQLKGCREELAHQVVTVQIQEEALKSLLTEVEEMRRERRIEEKARRKRAAIVIQKHWRGHHTRKLHRCTVSSLAKDKSLVSLYSTLKGQVSYLEESMVNLTNLVVHHQLDLPPPVNLMMSHYSPSCLLIQWEPPSDTPPCTLPLIRWPDIVGFNIYLDGHPEGMVNPNKHKAYIEGLENSTTYQITVRALYQGNRESPDSNRVIARLTSPSLSKTSGLEDNHTESIQKAVPFSALHRKDTDHVALSTQIEGDPAILPPPPTSSTIVPPLSLDLLTPTGQAHNQLCPSSGTNITYCVEDCTMEKSEKTERSADVNGLVSRLVLSEEVLENEEQNGNENEEQNGNENEEQNGNENGEEMTKTEEESHSKDCDVEKQPDEKPMDNESGDHRAGKEATMDEAKELATAPPAPNIKKPLRFFQDPTQYHTSVSPPLVSGDLSGSVPLSIQEEGLIPPSSSSTQPPLACTPPAATSNNAAADTLTTTADVVTMSTPVTIKTNLPFPMIESGVVVGLTHCTSMPIINTLSQNSVEEEKDCVLRSCNTVRSRESINLYQRSFYRSSDRPLPKVTMKETP